MLIALLLGKITYKELKEHVRKYTEKFRITKGRNSTSSSGDFSSRV